MSSISVSDIVNAKIVDLLLECCRKTVMECSYHYGFDTQEALGKMGLLTDYSALTNLTMSHVGMPCGSVSGNMSVSDVSEISVKVELKDDASLKVECKSNEKVVKEKKPRVKKVKEVVGATVPVPEVSEVGAGPVAVVSDSNVVVKEKKPRVKKVKEVVSEGVAVVSDSNSNVVVKEKKPRVKKVKDVDDNSSSKTKELDGVCLVDDVLPKEKGKGRPKKEKKVTESDTAIDDLFANLISKSEDVKEEVKEEVIKQVNEVVVSVSKCESQVPVVPKVDVVNKIDFQGTTYLKSKNTGIIYNMEQDAIGKWNENTSTIDFDEEEEEEYEDE